MSEAAAEGLPRVVFAGHSAALSGAELGLLDTVPAFPDALVCLFEDGPLVGALQARGVAVKVLRAASGTLKLRRSSGLMGALRAVPDLLRLARGLAQQLRPGDVLLANSQKAWIVAGLVAALHRHRVIWHLHDIVSASHFSPLMGRIGAWLANRYAGAVIVNSAATGESLAFRGVRRGLIRVVYNGVDHVAYQGLGEGERRALRVQLGIPAGRVLVGLFGRITPWKGQHVLLEALKALPGIEAILVGAPLFGEDAYLHSLQQTAAQPALAGRVRLLGHRSDVPVLMQTVDIVVHASTAPEPFGRVIVEAMLARRPVIATRAGGVTEIIADQTDGWLIPPSDARALAAAIATLAGDAARATSLAQAGQRKAQQCYSVERMVHGIQQVVREVAGAGAGKSRVCHRPPDKM